MKPYFCPLNKDYFFNILDGSQDCEIRPSNHRGWNTNNIYNGRLITFSNGYGNYNRVTMLVSNVYDVQDMAGFGIPQWHIDAVEYIYGKHQSWLVAFVTALN